MNIDNASKHMYNVLIFVQKGGRISVVIER